MLEANDNATEEREHAIDGDMGVEGSGELTVQLLGCMVEAPLVGWVMRWVVVHKNSKQASSGKQTEADLHTAICRGGGRVLSCRRVAGE